MCKRLEKSFNRQKEREKKSFGCLSSGNFHRFVEYLITLLHWLIEAKCSCWESLFLCLLSLCRYNRCLFVLHFYLWILFLHIFKHFFLFQCSYHPRSFNSSYIVCRSLYIFSSHFNALCLSITICTHYRLFAQRNDTFKNRLSSIYTYTHYRPIHTIVGVQSSTCYHPLIVAHWQKYVHDVHFLEQSETRRKNQLCY